jgi:O-antigen/teichoic acid export membrane protein
MADFYSLGAARRSLMHFALGKVGAAVTGIAVLLLTLRWVPTQTFGTFVIFLAITEIFYLVSGLGLSYYAQRYVPQLRIKAPASQFNRQVWRLLLWRTLLSIAFCIPLWLTMSFWAPYLDLPSTSASIQLLFMMSLITGCIMRYMDELLQTLMLQGWAQIHSVARNLLKLAALSLLFFHFFTPDIHFLLTLEITVATLSILIGIAMFAIYMRRHTNPDAAPVDAHLIPDAWQQSLRFYAAQVFAQSYGPNAVKLVVTSILGVKGAAVLGFAHSITDLLRNYSPAFLISGWVRPLMVARFVEKGQLDALKPLTQLIINVSLVGLIPFIMIFAAYGDKVASLLGANQYPAAAALLAPLVMVVCLQAVHVVMGMVCATIERTLFVLIATVICVITLPLAFFLTHLYGINGTVYALLASELLWLTTVLILIKRSFGSMGFINVKSLLISVLMAVILSLPLFVSGHSEFMQKTPVAWMVAAAIFSIIYWVLSWHYGVFSSQDKTLVSKLILKK